MPHPVIWFEVIGKDAARLSKFYGDLFGWKMDSAPNDYFMFTPDGDTPAGGVARIRPAAKAT